nr:unnamed protein product [Digitaria exilis]
MSSTSMDAIQKLYEVCKVSLSEKGPLSSEAIAKVHAVLEGGRHCSYFRRCPKSDPSGILLNRTKGSEFVWLEEYQPRDSFVIRRDLYTGPALKL